MSVFRVNKPYLINKRYEMYTLELNIDISITLNVIYIINYWWDRASRFV